MPRKESSAPSGFEAAIAIGRTLPDVEVTTSWGAPTLKVRGKMLACVAINKSAEPNSMVIRIDTAQRDLLIEEDPSTYYVTDHYVDYSCVLVRMSRVSPDALHDLLQGAHRFVSARLRKASAGQPHSRKASARQARPRKAPARQARKTAKKR